jgi:hypothetical protein
MKIHPNVTQQNGMILVSLQASFSGDPTDSVDKANILAFGDPMVNLTGGTFVDNTAVDAAAAALQRQDLTFQVSVAGPAGNAVTIEFIAIGSADATAITTTADAVVVDILSLSATRTTAEIKTLFDTYGATRANTSSGGVVLATGGSSTPAVTGGPFDFSGGAPAYTASFSFGFPASDYYVGVTTQMAAYQARFMTQLPVPALGIPAAVAGPLDCITSDTKRAAQFWIDSIESRISDLMIALRQRTQLGPQSDATV